MNEYFDINKIKTFDPTPEFIAILRQDGEDISTDDIEAYMLNDHIYIVNYYE